MLLYSMNTGTAVYFELIPLACSCLCSMKRLGLKTRVEIAVLKKGILSTPPPPPPPSFVPSLPLSQWIYHPPSPSTGLLNGPQLLNSCHGSTQSSHSNGGCRAPVKKPDSLSIFVPEEKDTEINLEEKYGVQVAYEAEILIDSTCTLRWAGATRSHHWTATLYSRTEEGCKYTVEIFVSKRNLSSLQKKPKVKSR